ncbi:MAG: DNA polymerase III subunit delta [Bryobacter sp.]|jgi:DNA polymerase-3 subunit delta|nr:DNA polymerase III subunit delta [Bryobacter sp.]
MPPAAKTAPLMLICGEDDFTVKERARAVFKDWCQSGSDVDQEIVDATALNTDEALRSLSRLNEALQTLPFFGSTKVVWFRDCNFLGEDRISSVRIVTERLASLVEELKRLPWDKLRLLISAGKVDRRKVFFKSIEKLGVVEGYDPLSVTDKDWTAQAELFVREQLRARGKDMSDEAINEFITTVGPNYRELANEVEKLALYVGDRQEIASDDVACLTSRHKQTKSFGLAEALGDRDLPRALRRLDEEFWAIRNRVDRDKTSIGLLYSLISKVRVLLLLKELITRGFVKPGGDYQRFKSQIERLPADQMPEDRKYNPAAINAFMLFKALPQAANFTLDELVAAMDRLLACNLRLVSSGLDDELVLQQALVSVIGASQAARRPTPRGR